MSVSISDFGGETPQGYDGLLSKVGPSLHAVKRFYCTHRSGGGWRVVEIRESREDATRFFAATIASRLLEGIHPKLPFAPLHDVLWS